MLLSDWILSKRNEGLTLKAAKWVISNALSIPSQQLTEICRQADHPLMQDETLFDDAPNEVRALFVSTPLLPRKYFNGAFAWLFGESRIEEMKKSSFQNYEDLLSKHPEYLIDHKWDGLPFTKDEYNHIYATFYDAGYKFTGTALGKCLYGLHRHQHISSEAFIRLRQGDSYPKLNENASEEVARICFNRDFDKEKNKFEREKPCGKAELFLSGMSESLRLNNLKQDMPNMVIDTFGLENFEYIEVFRLYNRKIPDEIMSKMLELKMISAVSIERHSDLILDERIPLDTASKAVDRYDDTLCAGYLKRNDVDPDMRIKLLNEMMDRHYYPFDGLTHTCKHTITNLIESGILTLHEIEVVECEDLMEYEPNSIFEWSIVTGNDLPPKLQDRWIKLDIPNIRFSGLQLQAYWDVSKIVKLISEYYIDSIRPCSPLGLQFDKLKDVISHLFQNKGWTGELLLELLKVCNQQPAIPQHQIDLDSLRMGALCKLFSESIYPTLLDCGDGVGKYGRAEIPLVYVLRSHSDMLSQCDLELIAQSNIQFDYKDNDIDLASELMRYPDLNEAAIAQQLKRRLGQFGDMPACPRKSHHI